MPQRSPKHSFHLIPSIRCELEGPVRGTTHESQVDVTCQYNIMEQIAAQINELLEFPIDFEGQKKVDRIVFFFVPAAAILSVLAGFITQNLLLLLVTFGLTVFVTLVLVLPPWAQYRQNPVQWLQVKYEL